MKILKYGIPILLAIIVIIALTSTGKQKNNSQQNQSDSLIQSEFVEDRSLATTIEPRVFEQLINSGEYTVIDVRTPEERALGKITPDALEIDFYDDTFKQQIAQLNPDDKYLVYCRSGNRSNQSLEIFTDLGFNNVQELDGGMLAWEQYQSQPGTDEGLVFGETLDIDIQGQNHVAIGTTDYMPHNSNPPTSGDHYPQAPKWGVYKKEIPDLSAVHALEHGGIWISYQSTLSDEDIKVLKKIANSNAGAVIMSPRDSNPAPIAINSWGKLMYLEAPDTAKIQDFIDTNKNNTHEPFAR